MNITQSNFGKLSDGREIAAYTLKNTAGNSVKVITYGARLVAWEFGGVDVVLGYADAATYERDNKFMGAVVGRFANRIDRAQFCLNDHMYALDQNDGNNHLHGGFNGFYQKIWEAEVKDDRLIMTVKSPDGESGYPGNFTAKASYRLTDADELIIGYEAECDQDTLCNLTNHAYFNLDGYASGDILSQKMQIFADSYTWANEQSIPDGRVLPVAGTPMDLRELTPIGAHIDDDFDELRYGKGYDHNWCAGKLGQREKIAVAEGVKTNIRLTVFSDLPGVQFYAGNYMDADLAGKNGVKFPRRSGFCLETQLYPNSINIPAFDQPILRRGETWRSETTYALSRF